MGRQKRPFPLGRFRLRYPKNYDKGKVYPIEIIYIFGGRTLRRNMNISVTVADWNPNYNTPRFSDRHNYGGMTKDRYICKNNTSVIFESLLTAPRSQVFNPLKI